MRLDPGWLAAQGDDAPLLHWINAAFAKSDGPAGVAVSGGGDSMALLHLVSRWAQAVGQSINVVTVDHNLRAGSANEARQVAQFCDTLGLPHDILRWDNWDGHGNVQAAARDARYRLIGDWAQGHGIAVVALGHTRDDAVETFVMRLARKAGIDGLALMDRAFHRDGILWQRPLWQTDRAALRDYLTRHQVAWVDDPSNDDMDFERVRVRKALGLLAEAGVRPDALHHAAHVAKEARGALDYYTRQEAARLIQSEDGDLVMTLDATTPDEIARRLRSKAVQWIGGLPYPPRLGAMRQLSEGLKLEGVQTLGGALITMRGDTIRFAREANAVTGVTCDSQSLWDNRWRLNGPHGPDLRVAALGDGILDCPDWRATGRPRRSLMATPAVWRGSALVAAPIAGHQNGWTASIVADFHSWLDAH